MTALMNGFQALISLFQGQGAFGLRNLSMAAGHLCFLLLSVSMAAGLLYHTHWLGNKQNWWLDEIHQWAGAWTVYTGLVHGLLLHYGGKSMSWTSILLPSVSGGGERGIPLALGIYGLYAFVAVTASGYLLGTIKGYLWRWLHWLSFPAWALSLGHVLLLSHRLQTWAVIMYSTCGVVVVGLTLARYFVRRKPAGKAAPAEVGAA